MILPQFEYVEPASIEEICSALQHYAGKASVIAGGTDLLVNLKLKKIVSPEVLISPAKIPQLRQMYYSASKGLRLGSLMTMGELGESKVIAKHFPALVKAANKVGSAQIRNRATIGGNICSARPAADTLGPLISYGAKVNLVGTTGKRSVAVEDFCIGPGQTVLRFSEVLTEILIKPPPRGTYSSYIKFGIRKAMDIAVVSVTSAITLGQKNKRCKQARIVLGAVAPTFVRCPESEQLLIGNKITEDLAAQAGIMAAQRCSPISDIRGSAEYRRMLVESLVKRSILEACSNQIARE